MLWTLFADGAPPPAALPPGPSSGVEVFPIVASVVGTAFTILTTLGGLWFWFRGRWRKDKAEDAAERLKTTAAEDERAKSIAREWYVFSKEQKEEFKEELARRDKRMADMEQEMRAAGERERKCLDLSARQEERLKWLTEENARLRQDVEEMKVILYENGLRDRTDTVPALRPEDDKRKGSDPNYRGPFRRQADNKEDGK